MNVIHGIALPDRERHYVGTLTRLMEQGCGFEYPALRRVLEVLPAERRRVAVDVGAHIGLWARWLVKRFKFVHAFEPVNEHADLFAKNVPALNYNLHRVALGAGYGAVAIKEYPENTGQAHIAAGEGDVTMLALDLYRLADVDLIKVDVEGYELEVLKGAEKTLREWRPIVVVEQRGCDEGNFGRKRDEALGWLQALGMAPIDCIHHDWILNWK